eukprot:1300145-Alexandrium_andersonii.AAC.1
MPSLQAPVESGRDPPSHRRPSWTGSRSSGRPPAPRPTTFRAPSPAPPALGAPSLGWPLKAQRPLGSYF